MQNIQQLDGLKCHNTKSDEKHAKSAILLHDDSNGGGCGLAFSNPGKCYDDTNCAPRLNCRFVDDGRTIRLHSSSSEFVVKV